MKTVYILLPIVFTIVASVTADDEIEEWKQKFNTCASKLNSVRRYLMFVETNAAKLDTSFTEIETRKRLEACGRHRKCPRIGKEKRKRLSTWLSKADESLRGYSSDARLIECVAIVTEEKPIPVKVMPYFTIFKKYFPSNVIEKFVGEAQNLLEKVHALNLRLHSI